MSADTILTARSILTMDPDLPRGTAVAVSGGRIVAVGDLEACRAALPGAEARDLGDSVLMPGFVEPHSHLLTSGMATQAPAHWIAPYVGFPSYPDVVAEFRRVHAETEPGRLVFFQGFDKLLHAAEPPDVVFLDGIFGDRPVVIWDNSGHVVYFNTAVIRTMGWDTDPPEDPPAGYYGRSHDGSLNGQASETPALVPVLTWALTEVATHPLESVARWYASLARAGITAASDMSYATRDLSTYEALTTLASMPIRTHLYHMSTEDDCEAHPDITAPDLVRKQGIKLWADGSPWVGNVALSFPYLDSEAVRRAGITPGVPGVAAMNYDREALDAALHAHATSGWQMAIHANGDLAIDVVLDAFQAALTEHRLLDTDHRWRMEHCGAMTAAQFERAAALGVEVSLGMFQFTYWGDLVDGEMFDSEHGARWSAAADAVAAGVEPSFHNDGMVSPANPLLNAQSAVARTTVSGAVHGPEQAVSLDAALRAITVNGARQLHRDADLGSIAPGRFADFAELSADPYEVDPARLATDVEVRATWLAGARIDLDEFLIAAGAEDPTAHEHLRTETRRCC